jgi:carbon storage regulator
MAGQIPIFPQDLATRRERCYIHAYTRDWCQIGTDDSGGLSSFLAESFIHWPVAGPHPAAGTPLSWRIAVMLVLSRKVGEKLVIGENITVVVSRVSGNRVTLAIEAPRDVRVVRGELRFEEATKSAAALSNKNAGYELSGDVASMSVPRLAK